MKILLINTVYKTGSTGKIVHALHSFLLQSGFDSTVCYGRGKSYNKGSNLINISSGIERYIHAFLTRITGFQGTYSFLATRKLFRLIDVYKPDVIHLFSLHGYYINEFKLFRFIKDRNIKTVYSMMDEYAYMGKCTNPVGCNKFETKCHHCPQVRAYPKSLFFDRSSSIFEMKKEAYENLKNITFTGPRWVIDRAKKSALLSNMKFAEIDEFTDLENVFYPREISGLRNKLGIPADKKIVLNVGPFVYPRKGGIYYLKAARMLEKENIIFIHVGYDGKTENLPDNFIPVNYLADPEKLAEYYSLADLFVCTSLADTMPNVCLEALSCGTPVCGFHVDGIPYVATPEFGTFVPLSDVPALASVIKSAPIKTKERSFACRAYAEGRYSKNEFCSRIIKLYSNKQDIN